MGRLASARKGVQRSHGVRVVAVVPYEPADVFCLSVPKTQCFAVADGIIVSNCYDETRYELMGVRHYQGQTKLTGL
jgi:hypothetical protein